MFSGLSASGLDPVAVVLCGLWRLAGSHVPPRPLCLLCIAVRASRPQPSDGAPVSLWLSRTAHRAGL